MEDRMLSDEILLGIINSKSGGGGGGTSNYNDLSNQPQIGGVTLIGNMTASDLGLATESALANKADKSAVKNEFLGTLDEWNALTVEQRKEYDTYQIKGDYTEGSSLPDYSTTEQKTGQKWIDGKDIYFKTLATPISITANDQWIDTGLNGIDSLIDYTIRLTRDGEPVGSGFNSGYIDVVVRNNALSVKGHSMTITDLYAISSMTVYYTKIT